MRRDAEAIASSYATLESLDATVRVEARVLRVQRHELANAARLPIKWSDSGPTSAAALALVDSLPAPQTLQHSDGVKRQLALVRGLLSDIDAGRAAVASACEQRQILLALLDSPELAKQPTWNRAIAVVCQRARTVGERLEPADALVVLGRESDTLLACVDAFRARVMPNGVRGSHLPEAELGALIQDGQCLQGEVQALWERTRILAAAGTGPARR